MLMNASLNASDHDAKTFAASALITLSETGLAAHRIADEIAPETILMDNARMLVALHLWLSGPMRPSEIASLIGMTTGGTTKIVQKLEVAGLVSKRSDDEDGRALIVALTAKGRRTLEDLTEALVPVMDRAVNHLGALRTLAD